MAQRPVVPLRSTLKKYYVYDPGVRANGYLGGMPIKLETGRKFVLMNDEQAQYWARLGVIGEVPIEQVDAQRRTLLHQMSGGRIPLDPAGEPSRVMTTAVQNPRTTAAAMAQGFHPVTGTREVTDEERLAVTSKRK